MIFIGKIKKYRKRIKIKKNQQKKELNQIIKKMYLYKLEIRNIVKYAVINIQATIGKNIQINRNISD
ncbi:MAG: hypothetical protein CMM87_05685 [Rickettsiales bacterium]|nr:hypothetical protein [Rickettsiales bacterium]